jgi:hypothetical protein
MADIRGLSEAKNICAQKGGGGGENTSTFRSKSKVEERDTMNESSSESARKASPSLDPREERMKPVARVESAARNQRGHTEKREQP